MAESNVLITIAATASVEDIFKQVRQAGASHVDLLLPDGAPALHSRKACDRLRELANRESIELLLYTADDAVITAAQKCQLGVVPVDPSAFDSLAAPASPAPSTPAPPPPAETRSQPTLSQAEQDFLNSLDSVPEIKPPTQQSSANDWAALAAETVAPATPSRPVPNLPDNSSLEEDLAWFNAFNDLSDTLGGDDEAQAAAPARPRIRPEDIELSDEDLHRQTKEGRREARDQRARDAKKGNSTTKRSRDGKRTDSKRTNSKRTDSKRTGARGASTPQRSPLPLILALVGVLVIAALVWFLFFRKSGVTIEVRAPAKDSRTFSDVRINLTADPVADPTSAAVQGRIITLTSSAEQIGMVQQETAVPDQAAKGVITLYNRLTQDMPLPAGTTLVTTNLDGQQVQYRTTSDTVVPAASVSFNGTQNGVADVPIEASAGGVAYNLPPRGDDATLWTVGDFGGSIFAVNTVAIEGGTVRMERIPTQEDINALLPQVLPQLVSNAVQDLQGQLQPSESLLGAELFPNAEALASDPTLYQFSTEPLPDVEGGFKLVVTANFSALAFQGNVDQELKQRALPNALTLTNEFQKETSEVASYTQPRLSDSDANIILFDVETKPKGQQGELAAEVIERLKADLSNKSLAEAKAVLADYINRQEISGFEPLPDITTMPDGEDINIKVVP